MQIVDEAVARAMAIGGDAIACRAGCTHCCIGPFAVTTLDLELLGEGLAALRPEMASRIGQRAAEARAAMREEFPGNWASGVVDSQEAADRFDERHAGLPCPVLDLETGGCALYSHRPIACRLHGPALTIDGLRLDVCRLNYVGQSKAEVDSQRVEIRTPPDPPENPLSYIAWIRPPATSHSAGGLISDTGPPISTPLTASGPPLLAAGS